MRGWQMGDLYSSDRRITTARVRRNGQQHVVPPAEAIQVAAQALKQYTPSEAQSLGVLGSGRLTNEQALVVTEFAQRVLNTDNIDNLGRALDGAAIWGIENALVEHYRRPPLRSIQQSDAIVVLNSNLHFVSPQAAAWVVRAKQDGATVILIDEVPDGFALQSDMVLVPEPGTFHAALLQLTEAVVEGEMFGAMGADAAEATRLDPDQIQRAAEVLRQAQRPTVAVSASALSRPREGYLAASLARSLTGSSREAADILYAVGSAANSRGVTLMGMWPIDPNGERQGASAEEMMRGQVDALVAVDAPIEAYAGRQGLKRLRDNIEFLCVIAPYDSETADIADVVLPMDTWNLDGGTLTGGGEGVWLVGGPADAPADHPLVGTLGSLANAMGASLPDLDRPSIRQRISRSTFAGFGEIDWEGLRPGQPAPLGAGYSPVVSVDREAFTAAAAEPLHTLGAADQYPLTILVRQDQASMAFDPRVRAVPVLEREWASARDEYVTAAADTAEEIEATQGRPLPVHTQFGRAQPTLRIKDGIPENVIVLPWHCRDLVFTLCGPGNIDEATGVLSHPPVAASAGARVEAHD